LIQSKGSGTMNYNGSVTVSKKTPPYSRLDLDTFKIKPFQTALNFNYLDEFDTGIIRMGDSSLCSANAALGLRPTQLGAYYDRNGRSGLMFNRLDLGIHAGIQLEAGGWFIAARVSYGLSDVLNNNYHAYPVLDENKKFVLNNSVQRNIAYELNLGYSF
jgi:hypothetical protein